VSADNYMLIRRDRGQYVVTMEFASDDRPGRVDRKSARRFKTLAAARDYALGEWTEYGVRERVSPARPRRGAARPAGRGKVRP
jgi:hypothetical protein